MKALVGDDWTQPKSTVLMGHSYGGGTAIEAAFNLKEDRTIKCVVALDPWLLPLKAERLQ
jgi:thioesterase domain-containing protein